MRFMQDRRYSKPPYTRSKSTLVYQPYPPLASISENCFGKIFLKGVINMPKDAKYIFVAFITLRNGKRIYARQYGRRAFRIAVKN